MERKEIPIDEFLLMPFFQYYQRWFLLTAGDFATQQYNCMTVSWGSMGIIWNKPFVQALVRPQRYTYQFMEKFESFTLSTFGREYRPALDLLGSKSGRDGDKIAESGLTAIPSSRIAAPGFAEAQLIVECRKMYWDDLNPAQFLDKEIEKNYPRQDYHRMYFGEILAISGINEFSGK